MYLRCRDDSAGVYLVHEAQYRRVWEQQQAEETVQGDTGTDSHGIGDGTVAA